MKKDRMPIRGVNLGAWLVLEKWMVPSLFKDLKATDETSWCVEMGAAAGERLRRHWDSFITREDFAWIAEHGLSAVRIPVGHWIFGADYPYHPSYGSNPHPYVTGGIEVVDRAMDWAREFGLGVMLDLHAAPGCQNGFDNGGIKDVCEWHTRPEYLAHSLQVLERLAERYHAHPALHAIEVLNEPRWDVPTHYLKSYYLEAYARIRRHCPPSRVAVVFHDGFRSHHHFLCFLQRPEFLNVIFDVHRYQCFAREDIDLDIHGHMNKVLHDWRREGEAIEAELTLPCICGEWSLGMDLQEVSLWAEGPFNSALDGLDAFQRTVAFRGYASAQLATFEQMRGWFFWSYRTEVTPAWCLRDAVERGWLPASFA